MVSVQQFFADSLRQMFSTPKKKKRAKKAGDEAMVYVYKTLMNSLYGRFGIMFLYSKYTSQEFEFGKVLSTREQEIDSLTT